MSDTDTTFNFVIAMLQSQLFNLLCDKADDVYGGRLPVHVRCLLDEFANIGQIPNFDKLIATIRSREISASIILQSQSQLKTIYKDAADTIVGNCDTTLFLGGKEKSTLKEISELLGKETIDSFNQSENRGSQVSHGLNYQKLGKELMTQDEIAVMDGGKCISLSPATSGNMSAPGRGRRRKSPPSKNGWNRAGRNVPITARRNPIGKSLRRSDKEVSLCPIMTMTKIIPLPLSSPTWANTTRAPLWANG